MLKHRSTLASAGFLLLLTFCILEPSVSQQGQGQGGGGALNPPGQNVATGSLVTAGQSVTLTAPVGDYIYMWTASAGGSSSSTHNAQIFTFTAPDVPKGRDFQTVEVNLLIRSVTGGCVNQSINRIIVYALPVCGISGPATTGATSTETYSYSGGSTGTLTYAWTIDGVAISGQMGSSLIIDWSKYTPGMHEVGLTLTKDYSSLIPGARNPTRSVTCSFTVTTVSVPNIVITKTPSKPRAIVGDTVVYTYRINNSGYIPLSGLTLTDDKIGRIALPQTTLDRGQSITATANYVVKESDLPGPLINTAAVNAKDSQNRPVTNATTSTVSLTYTAKIAVKKTPSKAQANVGDTVTYTYVISNMGTVTLNNIALTDNKIPGITLSKKPIAPGQSITATATYVVKESDLPGPLTNTATVNAVDSQNKPVINTTNSTVPLIYTAKIAVKKTPSRTQANFGDKVTYTYVISNIGTVTLNNIVLTDNKISGITLSQRSLAPGQSTAATASYVVKESDPPGPLINTATVNAVDSQNKPVTNTTSATVSIGYNAVIAIQKKASKVQANIGDIVIYNYTLTNRGNVNLSGIVLTDDKIPGITPGQTILAPGQSTTATATYVIKESDLPGPLINRATVNAKDSQNRPVTNTTTATVPLIYTSTIAVKKTPSKAQANVGDTVTYTYVINNTGTVTLNNIALTDNKISGITLSQRSLAPGQSTTATATYVVKESDLPGPLTNIATVTAKDSQRNPVKGTASATVQLTYTASLAVNKTASKAQAAVGEAVTYTYIIKNTGAVIITSIIITDDKIPGITLAQTTLVPGQSITATKTYVVTESDLPGPLTNTATVTAMDSQNKPLAGTATATVMISVTSAGRTEISGPSSLCKNKAETYIASLSEDRSMYDYAYAWIMDGVGVGTGKSIQLSGANFELGSHMLHVTAAITTKRTSQVEATYIGNMTVEVIPEPEATFEMDVSDGNLNP